MQSIRAQRMRKVMHIQGEVGGRKEFNVKVPDNLHEILRKSKSTSVVDLAVQDIKKKILNDDFNTFRNYDILNADTEKKPGIAFKSMHNMYDLQTLKITKLYKKKPKTTLEEEVRKQLQQDADKQMLLCEIYEQLDEVEDGEVLKKKELHPVEESIITIKQENQIDEAADITQWTKKLKQSKKKGLKMGAQAPPPRKSQRAVTEFIRQAVVKMDDRSPSNDSQKSIKDKLQSAFKKVKQIHELKGDLSVQKSIQQYMSRASQVMEFQSKLGEIAETQDLNKFDFSTDGVQRYYNILVKGQALEFKSESEKAKFYRKQTQIIIGKMTEQDNLLKQQLNEKEGETQKLRVESHEIHEKLGQIKILLEQLQEELDELHQIKSPNSSAKVKSPGKHSRQSLINTLMTSAQKQQELEKDIKILIDSRSAYKSKLVYNRRFLDRLDNEVYLKKKEKKKLNQSLIAFLYYLLKGGEDVRNNGIGWIITQLNRLGERVAYKTMPDFLDQKCKEYLLQKAVILHDIDILEQDQSESFKTYKQESADSSLVLAQKNLSMSQDSLEMSSLPSIFPTDSNKLSAIDLVQARQDATKSSRNNYALETLGPITLGLNHEQIEALESMLANLNKVNVPVTNSTLIYQETQKKIKSRIMGPNQMDSSMDASSVLKEEAIRQYDKSNQQLNKIKSKLTILDDEQVHRVAKEFDYKSYAKRFGIDPITVISCLVGGGRCDREIVKYGFKKLNDS